MARFGSDGGGVLISSRKRSSSMVSLQAKLQSFIGKASGLPCRPLVTRLDFEAYVRMGRLRRRSGGRKFLDSGEFARFRAVFGKFQTLSGNTQPGNGLR